MRIDHVIWATADLDATAARLQAEHGLRAGGGGRHAGHGTHNRIVALGGGYLELVAIADADEAQGSPFGRAIATAPEGLFGWAAAVADLEAHAARLAVATTRIERDGMHARLAGVAEALAQPWLPFLIERPPGVADPGAIAAASGGIAWLELCGDESTLWGWIGGASLPLRIAADGRPGIRAVGLRSGAVIR